MSREEHVMAKFVAYVETNKIGSRCLSEFEIPDEDLEGLDELAREKVLEEWAHNALFASGLCTWGWAPEGEIRE
jgi:hypothetical protein